MQYWKAFCRVRLILRIFYKPNKLVGVVKCSDRVVVKWESDDQANELYRQFKLKEKAEQSGRSTLART